MPNQQGNGRNVALPDENRPSWRPQDENARNRRSLSEEDDRYDDDRYARSHWEDRERRDYDTERYGQGQSGYTSGRYDGDRSMQFQSRNQGYPGSFEDRYRERGTTADDRFSGRGGSQYHERGYNPERYGAQGGYGGGRGWEAERIGVPRGYGYDDGDRDRDRMRPGERSGSYNLGTGGGMHGGMDRSTRGQGGHRGKGPSGYHRSDERIREMACEALTDDDRVDATNIEIHVRDGEVTLTGHVDDRQQKRMAEDCVENVMGVKDVHNQLKVGSKH
jgi:BON domain-containing protein